MVTSPTHCRRSPCGQEFEALVREHLLPEDVQKNFLWGLLLMKTSYLTDPCQSTTCERCVGHLLILKASNLIYMCNACALFQHAMGTQFWVKLGNGDPRQHKWGPKKRTFDKLCYQKLQNEKLHQVQLAYRSQKWNTRNSQQFTKFLFYIFPLHMPILNNFVSIYDKKSIFSRRCMYHY